MKRRWSRDRSGTTALEFAIIGPVFITLLLMVFEFAVQLAVDLALNFGTASAARYAITGAVSGTNGSLGSNATNDAAIRTVIVSSTGGLLASSRVMVTATSYADPASYAAGAGQVSGSNGASGNIVVYSVSYDQPFLFLSALRGGVSGSSYSITHQATVIVQNEPY